MAPPEVPRRGTSIRIFLADGSPDGLRIVERSNWTGRAILCSRAQYPEVRGRDEFGRPGVYLLIGPAQRGGTQGRVYVGEADLARVRLDQHMKGKDFWTSLILFTSKDENLNKAHVQYLESRLVALAQQAKRAELENGNVPQAPALSEADRADAESFLDEMLLIYPVLGVSAFEVAGAIGGQAPLLRLAGSGARGEGRDTPEGFLVLAGAIARKDEVPSIHRYTSELRSRLLEANVLRPTAEGLELTQDYLFESPSSAATVLMARTANGRIEWKDAEGRTLKEIQEAAIGE